MDIKLWNSLKIMKSLKKSNSALYEYVLFHCKNIESELDSICYVFKEYTDHSSEHAQKVMFLGDKLLADSALSEWEAAIFILAAYYHDVGMCCSQDELDRLIKNPIFVKESPYLKDNIVSMNQLKATDENTIDFFIKLEFLRRIHGKRSYEWVLEKFPAENSDSFIQHVNLWEAVATVCIGHCLYIENLDKKLYSTEYLIGGGVTVDLLFITCLLRLSDICHFSRDRALPYIRNGIDFYSDRSLNIWKACGQVVDTVPLEEGHCIKVSASCSNYNIHRAIIESASDIEAELSREHRILYERKSKYKLPWKFVDTSNVIESAGAGYFYTGEHFRLDFGKVTELLIGSSLYRNKLFALRECVQNSMDAINVYQIKDKSANNFIVIKYCDNTKTPYIDIFDNGTGMDKEICSKHLLSVGSSSFWYSERSYKDWGSINSETPIIASHGIGFLSSFLIADKIDVFSKYPDMKAIHMQIDSFKTGVVFKTTDISEFPDLQGLDLYLPIPWEQGHGTCIRLYIRNTFTKLELMNFFSKYLLRIPMELYFAYNNEIVRLSHIWNPNNEQEIPQEYDLSVMKDKLFGTPERDFYSNPPADAYLERDVFHNNGVSGKVFLNYNDAYSDFRYVGYDRNTRLTQNGILVDEGHEFILSSPLITLYFKKNPLVEQSPLAFDIDITGNKCFDLDAERTRIIDNEKNKRIREEIVDILIRELFNGLALIESTMYFPCGRKYYHGADSIFTNNDDLLISFHKELKDFIKYGIVKKYENYWAFDKICKSKLYILVNRDNNIPMSIEDILNSHQGFAIFIPKILKTKESLNSPVSQFNEWLEHKQTNMLIKLCSKMRIVILPGFPDTFTLPLLLTFEFDVITDGLYYVLVKPKSRNIAYNDSIEEDYFHKLSSKFKIPDSKLKSFQAKSKISDHDLEIFKSKCKSAYEGKEEREADIDIYDNEAIEEDE